MKAATAHKGAGWTGIVLAALALGQSYIQSDAQKHQAAQAAAVAQVNSNKYVEELEDELLRQTTLLRRALQRIDELDRRMFQHAQHRTPATAPAPAPAAASAPAPALLSPEPATASTVTPAPITATATVEDLQRTLKTKRARRKGRAEAVRDATEQIEQEAF